MTFEDFKQVFSHMLEELKEEGIVNKVGGRFKLSTLIQKRLVALNSGAPQQVSLQSNDKLAIVVQEILEDKIFLDTTGNVEVRNANNSNTATRSLSALHPGGIPTPMERPVTRRDDDDE
jgi:DNA-directed RNA polymerase subunit omega